MRDDALDNTSNGLAGHVEHASTSNGHTNGYHSNGYAQPEASTSTLVPLYAGSQIDRTEFVKLTLQALQDMGLSFVTTLLMAVCHS